jgi:hypothetical protein
MLAAIGSIQKGCYDDRRAAISAAAEQARVAKLTPEERALEQKRHEDYVKNQAAVAAMEAEVATLDQARFVCVDFVKRTLRDPDSAEFRDYHRYFAVEQHPRQFDVQVRLRARNGFNALRMVTVDCVTRSSGDNWRAVSLRQIPD